MMVALGIAGAVVEGRGRRCSNGLVFGLGLGISIAAARSH